MARLDKLAITEGLSPLDRQRIDELPQHLVEAWSNCSRTEEGRAAFLKAITQAVEAGQSAEGGELVTVLNLPEVVKVGTVYNPRTFCANVPAEWTCDWIAEGGTGTMTTAATYRTRQAEFTITSAGTINFSVSVYSDDAGLPVGGKHFFSIEAVN